MDPGSNPGGAIMKLLLELHDEDIGLDSKKMKNPKTRDAARAILLDGKKIALLFVSKSKYHKLPGGGAEKGENIHETLFREVDEETGCKIKIVHEIGKIIENRSHTNLIQTSYCYLAKKLEQHETRFEKDEIEDGFGLQWHDINSAIRMIESEAKENYEKYENNFIVRRDAKFLKAAKQIIDLRHPGL